MVVSIIIGVVGVQGAISEHVKSMNNVFKNYAIDGSTIIIKNKYDIKSIDALIIPGGESTAISKLLIRLGIFNEILLRIKAKNLPIMGTCAGCVLLSSELTDYSGEINLLQAMKMKVLRNGFGRQKFSFEKKIFIDTLEKPFNAVFIRAPIIEKIWDNCNSLCKINNKIIFARQDIYLAASFHPELTTDLRIHEYFLKIINNHINKSKK